MESVFHVQFCDYFFLSFSSVLLSILHRNSSRRSAISTWKRWQFNIGTNILEPRRRHREKDLSFISLKNIISCFTSKLTLINKLPPLFLYALRATTSVATVPSCDRKLSKTWYDCWPFMEHLFMLLNNRIHILSMFMRVRCHISWTDRGTRQKNVDDDNSDDKGWRGRYFLVGWVFCCCCFIIYKTVRWSSVARFVLWTNEWYVGLDRGFSMPTVHSCQVELCYRILTSLSPSCSTRQCRNPVCPTVTVTLRCSSKSKYGCSPKLVVIVVVGGRMVNGPRAMAGNGGAALRTLRRRTK